MDYLSVKKIPFKGYARAYETTVKRLVAATETGKEMVKEEKIIQFGELVEDKKNFPDYHEYNVTTSKYIGIVKVTIELAETKPYFKVGDEVRKKNDPDLVVTINGIVNHLYLCDKYDKDGEYDDDYCFFISEQDQWELVEEPVGKVWHQPDEKPSDKSKVVVWTGDEIVQCSYIYCKFVEKTPTEEHGRYVDVGNREDPGSVFISKRSRADLTELVVKWAYVDDLLNNTTKSFDSYIQEGDKVVTNEKGVRVNLSQLKRVAKSEGEFETFFKEYYEKSNDEIVTVYDRYEGLKDGATFALRRIGSIIGQGGNDYLVLEEVKSTINKLLKEL